MEEGRKGGKEFAFLATRRIGGRGASSKKDWRPRKKLIERRAEKDPGAKEGQPRRKDLGEKGKEKNHVYDHGAPVAAG